MVVVSNISPRSNLAIVGQYSCREKGCECLGGNTVRDPDEGLAAAAMRKDKG